MKAKVVYAGDHWEIQLFDKKGQWVETIYITDMEIIPEPVAA